MIEIKKKCPNCGRELVFKLTDSQTQIYDLLAINDIYCCVKCREINQDETLKRNNLVDLLQKAKEKPLSKKLVIFRDKIVKDVPIWVIEAFNELIKSEV